MISGGPRTNSAWLPKWQLWATLENCKNLYSAGSHKFTYELVSIILWDFKIILAPLNSAYFSAQDGANFLNYTRNYICNGHFFYNGKSWVKVMRAFRGVAAALLK